ncbi:unnamed protein product [Urochloa humidicola]
MGDHRECVFHWTYDAHCSMSLSDSIGNPPFGYSIYFWKNSLMLIHKYPSSIFRQHAVVSGDAVVFRIQHLVEQQALEHEAAPEVLFTCYATQSIRQENGNLLARA